ncbi:MAG: futalosine hydrolase [Planctomycetota bacterium]|jgi:futalosine hydrolase
MPPRPKLSPGDSPPLILIPTSLEQSRLEDLGGFGAAAKDVHLAGFGAVAAAARTAELIARLDPSRVLLVGIAGSFEPDILGVGQAACFDNVIMHGIGAWDSSEADERNLRLPSALGFPQWNAKSAADTEQASADPERRTTDIWEQLPLHDPTPGSGHSLLTVCAATGDHESAARLQTRYPGIMAEDMEAFGAALACSLTGRSLTVVRGISNRVGDRDPRAWRIDDALAAARELALTCLELKAE